MGWRSNSENQSLKTKTDLRERILEQAALPELRVLDLCAGSGDVWRNIGRRRPLAQYLPVDMKPQMPGTIKAKVNARFIAGFDIGRFNVVDVDTFGEPWEIWLALAPKLRGRTAVFLTHGYMTVGRCSLSNVARQAVGIPAEWQIGRAHV